MAAWATSLGVQMTNSRNRYLLLGISLMLGGALFAIAAYAVIGYMPLVALGVASVILGAISFFLGRTVPGVSVEAGQALFEAGLDNIASLVEELGLRSRAIYLPTSLTNGVPRALIPLHGNPASPTVGQRLEQRLIVRFGPGPEDRGILVATPGSAVLASLDLKGVSTDTDLEGALSAAIVGGLDLANRVTVLGTDENRTVEIFRPTLKLRHHPVYQVLGSPLASIVATLTAEIVGRPVSIVAEEAGKRGRHTVQIRLYDEVKA
ncbi:MAG: hypothetical protein Q8P22_00770 [Chloroflexota bacterium]|nr:hypothetical protein [Chloroflexota bacterium]